MCACTGSALAYYVSQRAAARDTTRYFGPQLITVWLHLQEAPRHLAPTMRGVVRGTQTKLHTHTYIFVLTQTMMLLVRGAGECVLKNELVIKREL